MSDFETDTDGTTIVNGIWNLKKKIFPKHANLLPVAKKNIEGRLVTAPNELKELYAKTFKHRLRHRPINDDLKNLEALKEELCSRRLELAKMTKSKEWDLKLLNKVLANLKNNKSRDPHGLINELFKPGVCGKDLAFSFMLMFNKIKEEMKFPEFMEF